MFGKGKKKHCVEQVEGSLQVFVGAGKMGNYTLSVYSPELVGTSVLLDHKLKTRFLLTIWKENKREK